MDALSRQPEDVAVLEPAVVVTRLKPSKLAKIRANYLGAEWILVPDFRIRLLEVDDSNARRRYRLTPVGWNSDMDLGGIKGLLAEQDERFWGELSALTSQAARFEEVISLSVLRRRAISSGLQRGTGDVPPQRIAILGACSLYPLHEILTHFLETSGNPSCLFRGEYDNYISEIMEAESPLFRFKPDVIILLPSLQRCKFTGALTADPDTARAAACNHASGILDLCRTAHERTGAEMILVNFMLPGRHDLGELRSRLLTSDWNFRKIVNLELALRAPQYLRICDLEFLTNRRGALESEDARGWFETKQPCSPELLVDLCREAARLINDRRAAPKKVLALDLDNTLWGGVVADDGLQGIEIGDTSARGEAFKAFQKYILSLKERGVLLAVCSKNDHERAIEVFEKHPEMVLRDADFVAFKANWEPKSDNIRRIALELNLGADSFVFVDDNPAEVEIVRQFAPEVTTILLGPDPATYVSQLQDCRMFEPRTLTAEDSQRTIQYRAEQERVAVLSSATDMGVYLESLQMHADIAVFNHIDAPRIAQLINKSNQFNLTTRRRSEAEVMQLIGCDTVLAFSVRLRDRFGDHGLISVVITEKQDQELTIDTWLMSCRVLKRQVEELVIGELSRAALARDCRRIRGVYLRTAKNDMVADLYPRMGFEPVRVAPECGEYVLDLNNYIPVTTKIMSTSNL